MAKVVSEKHELTFAFYRKHLLQMIGSLARRRIVRLQAVGKLRFGDKMPIVHVSNVLACDEWNIFCLSTGVMHDVFTNRRLYVRRDRKSRPHVSNEVQVGTRISTHRNDHLRWKTCRHWCRNKLAFGLKLIDQRRILAIIRRADRKVDSLGFHCGNSKFAPRAADAVFPADGGNFLRRAVGQNQTHHIVTRRVARCVVRQEANLIDSRESGESHDQLAAGFLPSRRPRRRLVFVIRATCRVLIVRMGINPRTCTDRGPLDGFTSFTTRFGA